AGKKDILAYRTTTTSPAIPPETKQVPERNSFQLIETPYRPDHCRKNVHRGSRFVNMHIENLHTARKKILSMH
ncbi:MAG: hypothetical protein JXA28_06775, partial [Bacteroidetes bacterium]|nr:hypothetical protein [Bacteroidota bacterium]